MGILVASAKFVHVPEEQSLAKIIAMVQGGIVSLRENFWAKPPRFWFSPEGHNVLVATNGAQPIKNR